MASKGRYFQKGSGCYTCRCCGKLTRSTGRRDNEFSRLCVYCFEEGGLENELSDGLITQEQFDLEIQYLKKAHNRV